MGVVPGSVFAIHRMRGWRGGSRERRCCGTREEFFPPHPRRVPDLRRVPGCTQNTGLVLLNGWRCPRGFLRWIGCAYRAGTGRDGVLKDCRFRRGHSLPALSHSLSLSLPLSGFFSYLTRLSLPSRFPPSSVDFFQHLTFVVGAFGPRALVCLARAYLLTPLFLVPVLFLSPRCHSPVPTPNSIVLPAFPQSREQPSKWWKTRRPTITRLRWIRWTRGTRTLRRPRLLPSPEPPRPARSPTARSCRCWHTADRPF